MKALTVSREYPPAISGVATFIYEILSRIKSFDYKIICAYEKGRKKSKNIAEIKSPGFIRRIRYISAAYFCIKSIFKSLNENPDIIIGNALSGSMIATLIKFLKRKPLVSIIHDIDYISKDVEEFDPINKLFRKLIQRLIFLSSDKIIVVSNKVKKDIICYHQIKSKKIIVVPNGVSVRKKFKKLKKTNPVILFVGVLLRKHGIEYLIESFNLVKHSIKNVELWIVGPIIFQDYFKYLKKLVHENKLEDSIKFVGGVKNPTPYYDACDIFAISSYHSVGFGIPPLEASSFGKPVVATKIYEQTGVVINNKTGLIVPPKNPEAMANVIIKLFKNKKLRERLGKNGKIFSKKFNWDTSAKKFEELCLELKK